GQGEMADIDKIRSLGAEIAPNSFCALAPGALMPVLSGLESFQEDFRAHVEGQACPYGGRA
ncbi:MAG: NADH-ubiquinone oxidoreductase-F iron-sulfur binding region domain-containing protein, partial [Acidithiobacillus sp.]